MGVAKMRGGAAGLIRRLLSFALVLVLSGVIPVATAIAAELLSTAELQGGSTSIIVKQGESVRVTLRLSSSGNISSQVTQANPATVSVFTRYAVGASGVQRTHPSEAFGFWASAGNGNRPVTWSGAPTPYTVTARVEVAQNAPLGTRTIPIVSSLTSPNPSGSKFEDSDIEELTITVIAGDSIAPVTTSNVSGTAGANGWYVSDAAVTLSATDEGTGVKSTYYNFDGGTTWNLYTAPVAVTTNGPTTLYYFSEDNAGNKEVVKSVTVRVDKEDPLAAIDSPLDGDYVRSAVISYRVGDSVSGLASHGALLNGSPVADGATVTAEGEHELRLSAVDNAGRRSERTVRFTVDATAPVIEISGPQAGVHNADQTLAFSVTDNLTGTDDLAVTSTHPNGTVFSADGSYVVGVEATDRAENRAVASRAFVVDKTAPVTGADVAGTAGGDGWFRSNVSLELTLNDALSGAGETWYRIGDEGAFSVYSAPVLVTEEGITHVWFYSVDAAGNAEAAQRRVIKIDKTKPVTDITLAGLPGRAGWWRSTVAATASSTDALSGVAAETHRVNGGPWVPGGSYTVPYGVHAVEMASIDTAGNDSDIASAQVKVDNLAPLVEYDVTGDAGANGWFINAATVALSVTDDAEGSGAAEIEYSTDGWNTSQEYAAPVSLADEGDHRVCYRGYDVAGNSAEGCSAEVSIDLFDPVINVMGLGDGAHLKFANIAFGATDTDAGSGIASVSATLNGMPFAGGVVAVEGAYSLVVTAVDNAGRSSVQTIEFVVDYTAPVITFTSPVDGGYFSATQTLAYTVVDEYTSADELLVNASHADGAEFADEGYYEPTVSAEDKAGNIGSGSISFTIDKTAPVTSWVLDGVAGTNGWFVSDVAVDFSAADPVSGGVYSGVAGTYVGLDGSALAKLTDPRVMVTKEGATEVAYYSDDVAGNVEEERSFSIAVDKTKPTVDFSFVGVVGDDAAWYVSDVTVAPVGHDEVSGINYFEYSLNGADFVRWEDDLVIGEGRHSVAMRAVDKAGLVSDAVVRGVNIDKTGPTSSAILAGDEGANGWFLGDVTVTLDSQDNVAGSGVAAIRYTTDAEWTSSTLYSAPFTVSAAGVTTLQYAARDAAGNDEMPSKSVIVRIDSADPVIDIAGISEGDYVKQAAIAFGASDPQPGSGVAQVSATLNGEPFVSGTTVFEEGEHTLVVSAVDHAGRASERTVNFTVDSTSPMVTITNPADGGVYNADQAFSFVAGDNLTSAGQLAVTSSHVLGHVFSAEGAYSAWVRAVDLADNEGSASADFIIDRTAPTTEHQIAGGTAGQNGWWTSDVTLFLNAEDAESNGVASGVAASFYRVNGGPAVAYSAAGIVVADEGENTVQYWSVDSAGNVETVRSVQVRLDKTLPELGATTPALGATYAFGRTLNIDCPASDSVSGLAQRRIWLNGAEVTNGQTVTLTKAGANTLRVELSDHAGNTTVLERAFSVAYSTGEWLPPLSNDKVANAGRTLPAKVTVLDHAGKRVSSAVVFVEAKLVTASGAEVPVASGYAAVQDPLTNPFYQFDIKTLKGQVGTLKISASANDGATVMNYDVTLR